MQRLLKSESTMIQEQQSSTRIHSLISPATCCLLAAADRLVAPSARVSVRLVCVTLRSSASLVRLLSPSMTLRSIK